MERSPIEDRFTLPEGRRACRNEDFQVSTREYKRLRNFEKDQSGPTFASVDSDELRGNIAVAHIQHDIGEAFKRIKVTKGKGLPKAAKASSLREHDVEKGTQDRIEKIGRKIVDTIILDFKRGYTVDNFLNGDVPWEGSPLEVNNIQVPSMGWADDGDPNAPQSPSEDRRENFLYKLQCFVEREVGGRMEELLKIEFNGESIWDNWAIKVNLNHGSCSSRSVHADVFFAEIEKGEG